MKNINEEDELDTDELDTAPLEAIPGTSFYKSVKLPDEIKEDRPPSNTSALKNVVENIFALPAKIVLEIVKCRLSCMDRELQAVDELHLLSQVMTECHNILNKKLAPFRRTETCSPRSNIPYGPGLASPITETNQQQSDNLDFIRNILNCTKNAHAASSINKYSTEEQNSHKNVSMGSYQNPHTNSYQNKGVSSYQNSNYKNYYSSSQSNLSSSIPGHTSTNFSSPIPGPTSFIPVRGISVRRLPFFRE